MDTETIIENFGDIQYLLENAVAGETDRDSYLEDRAFRYADYDYYIQQITLLECTAGDFACESTDIVKDCAKLERVETSASLAEFLVADCIEQLTSLRWALNQVHKAFRAIPGWTPEETLDEALQRLYPASRHDYA